MTFCSAYDIDFSANTVGLWASTGGDDLTQVIQPVSASTSTNSEDWHIGELRLPNGGTDADAEDWFWSGIFIEEGPITTSIAGPSPGTGGSAGSSSSSSSASSTPAPSSTPASSSASSTVASTTSTASGPTQTKYGAYFRTWINDVVWTRKLIVLLLRDIIRSMWRYWMDWCHRLCEWFDLHGVSAFRCLLSN